MPVCAEAKPPGCVPAAERYVAPLAPASFAQSPATCPALLQKASTPGYGGGGKRRGARRCTFQLHGGFCKVALPDLSVLLYMCHLCKLHFDKLPVKWLL